ncbi:hypothetical protein ACPD8N_00665 [Lacticaseibacillus chiayiensis]|uniref:hypothetical protein n=1 Tax=Lacticaseibacillus chiayiensis TaxID=2100821 RepID=UPI003C764F89
MFIQAIMAALVAGYPIRKRVDFTKKECNRQQFEFEDDIGYQSMAEPYQYAVSLVQEMALSQPEETDRPEDKPEFDDDGHRIQYYSWSSQEAPEARHD